MHLSMLHIYIYFCVASFFFVALHYADVEKLKIEEDVRQKKAKNLLLMFAKVNLGVKKFVSPNAKIFVLCIFLASMSKWQKNAFKV